MSDVVTIGICTVDAIGMPVEDFPPPKGLRFFDSLAITTGGCAVNCAIALGKMGLACDTITKVGRDMLGDFIIAELGRYGVGCAGVVRQEGVNSPFTFVCVDRQGERRFIHTTGTNATFCLDDVDFGVIEGAKFVFVTGTALMPTFDGRQAGQVLARAQEAGKITLLDTVYVDTLSKEEWAEIIDPCLPHLDYFIPSLPEAMGVSGLADPSDMARYFQDKGCKAAAIKLDVEGVFVREADGTETRVPAYVVDKVVDATGAGDSWSAGFLAGLSTGKSAPESAALGNATAAHCIQAPGAATGIKSLDEIAAFMETTPTRG